MNEEHPHIINTGQESEIKKFPIFPQLAVLGLILITLFGGWLFDEDPTEAKTEIREALPPANEKTYPILPQKIKEVALKATAAYVWDVSNQRVLYSKNSDQELPLASITKLMTTLLVHELISETEHVVITKSAIQQEGSIGLLIGEDLNIEELRKLALISSSNDAAYALAVSAGSLLGQGDSAGQFIQGMNIKADELGLNTLEFWNTTGLDLSTTRPGSVGSARDVSLLMEHIITNYPEIIESTQAVGTRVYNSAGLYHDITNTNEIIMKIPNLIGSKTGYTDLAGGNLTIAFDIGFNHPIVITVLGSTYQDRFDDVYTLLTEVQKSISNQ